MSAVRAASRIGKAAKAARANRAAKATNKSAEKTATDPVAAAKGKEGVYSFETREGPYVGQSKDMGRRFSQHKRSGKLSEDKVHTVETEEVLGGKLARESAEHAKIQGITKGVPARKSDKVANERDPLGPKRQGKNSDAKADKSPDQGQAKSTGKGDNDD